MKFRFVWICLLLTACGSPEKRELRVMTSTPITSMDPHTTEDSTTLSFLSNIYEPLVSATKSRLAAPVLAISWSNPDENTWRFDLRKNVRFHDGSTFSAEDVKYSIDRGVNHPQSWIKPELPMLRAVRIIDSDTVEIVTSKPSPLLLNNLTRVLMIPKDSESYLSERCNGTGPYKLEQHKKEGAILKAFARYWKEKPYWDSAVFSFETDGERRLKAVLTNNADLVDHPPEERIIRLDNQKNARIIQSPGLKIMVLGFLVKDPTNPFSDSSVRKAIALAIDQQAIIDKAFFGLAEKSSQLVPPEVFGYATDLRIPQQDLQKAKEIFAGSKFPKGFRQTLHFGIGSGRIADSIIELLRPLGIELEKRESNWDELDRVLLQQEVPAYLLQWTFPVQDSGDILYFGLHTKTPGREYGALNFSGFSDAELDRVLEASASEMNEDRRRILLNQAMRIAMNSNVFIPLCIRRNFFAANNRLEWAGSASGKMILEEIHLKH